MELDEPLPPALQITDVPTHPHNPVDLSDGDFEDPTVTGGERFDTQSLPVVSVPEDEARRLAEEGLAVVNPSHEEDTAALELPPQVPPRPRVSSHVATAAEAPPGPRLPLADSTVGTRSERAPVPLVAEVEEAEARTARPAPVASEDTGLPGFVDASVIAAPPPPASYASEISEPRSLPGQPVHEAPAFEVDEDTFGPNEPMPPGTQLAFGIYRVDGLIGEGRMTRVYRATDLRTDTLVALKEYKDPGDALRLPTLRNLLERYRQEEPPPAVLEHEYSIALLDFFDDTTRGPVAVMEYVPAGDLESYLAHRGRPLAPREAAKLFVRVCEVLSHALDHGVVHGDMQPRNILLTEEARPKIDLVTPVLMGAPFADPEADFAPPEVREGHAAGPAADVYGLGASLYQAATDPRIAAEGGEAPRLLEPIIERCVEDDPAARYPTVRELGAALREALGVKATSRRPKMSRLMQLGLALAAIAVGLVVGVVVTVVFSDQTPPSSPPPVTTVSDVSAELMQDARALEADGKLLEAAVAYRRLMDANPTLPEPARAHGELVQSEPFKTALRELRRRLRKASLEDEASLREDLELLSVLAPNDALIDHWRSRLNQSNDKGAAGGPAE